MKVELLVLIPSLENNWKQKGNFNFAMKISKKLLAFGINWLLICRFYHEASELVSVSVSPSVTVSLFVTLIFSQSFRLSVSLSIILLVNQLVSLSKARDFRLSALFWYKWRRISRC